MTRLLRGLAVAAAVSGTGAAAGEAQFDVYLLGLKAGTLTLSMKEDGSRYAASGRIRSSGVVGAVADYRVDAEVVGRKTQGDRRPERYAERIRAGRDEDSTQLTFAGDVPQVETTEEPESHWLEPLEASGALDPLTTVWHLLRDRAEDDLCKIDTVFFDGARKGRVSARMGDERGDQVTCQGIYERLGGFSRKELKTGTEFPFSLVYARNGTGWKLTRMDVQSTRGRAQLIRR